VSTTSRHFPKDFGGKVAVVEKKREEMRPNRGPRSQVEKEREEEELLLHRSLHFFL